jgi:hypothetical protein
MSTTEITIPLQRGTGEVTLFLKSKIATVNLQKMDASATLRLQKNLIGSSFVFETAGWYDHYYDLYFDKIGVVGSGVGIILKLQGDK